MEEDKTFFLPGDLVTVRQDVDYKPKMIVLKKETSMFKNGKEDTVLRGIKCRWFTTSGELQEAVFNTKDLIRI